MSSTDQQNQPQKHLRVSIVTAQHSGVNPKNLTAGDQIYVRVVGPAAEHFPEHLQSERFEHATQPLESRVEAVRLSPDLPPDIDGNPENYVEIRVNITGGFNGRGYVYKDDRVKGKDLEESSDSSTSYLAALVFLGLGIITLLLAVLAFHIFG